MRVSILSIGVVGVLERSTMSNAPRTEHSTACRCDEYVRFAISSRLHRHHSQRKNEDDKIRCELFVSHFSCHSKSILSLRLIDMSFITRALFVVLIIPSTLAMNTAPSAQTRQGIYIGQRKTVNGTGVNYWYGIPYAQQPIGHLRWIPPQQLPTSHDIRYALIPNACPQKNDFRIAFTESCLTLNVYTPMNANNLPVYVWIHGGSFTTGAGVEYDAASFVSVSVKNSVPIVVVTINYRLGLLGFLADEALYEERSGVNNRSTTGNYGILDQMMAVDWIKKNAAGFGGDPEQITIGGESAGGVGVTILLTSPLTTNGTFQRAIIESGGLWPSAATPLEKAINSSGKILRVMANCTTLQCLRTITVEMILTVQNFIASHSIFGASAMPVIDGYVLNEIMEDSYERGSFQKVPVLIGSTTNETSLFTCPIFNRSASAAQVETFLSTLVNTTMLNEITSIYGPISTYPNPLIYLNIIYSDSWAHCGSRRIASRFADNGLPAYLYTYDHLIPIAPPCLGVAHAAELPMLFPDLLPFVYPFYKFNALEEQLSIRMTLYWANFIHTSDPNFRGNPTHWDPYQNSSDGDLVLDISSQMRYHHYDFVCSRLWDRYA